MEDVLNSPDGARVVNAGLDLTASSAWLANFKHRRPLDICKRRRWRWRRRAEQGQRLAKWKSKQHATLKAFCNATLNLGDILGTPATAIWALIFTLEM